VIPVSPFSFGVLQFRVVAQPFANCGHRNDQQNDDGEANSEASVEATIRFVLFSLLFPLGASILISRCRRVPCPPQ